MIINHLLAVVRTMIMKWAHLALYFGYMGKLSFKTILASMMKSHDLF